MFLFICLLEVQQPHFQDIFFKFCVLVETDQHEYRATPVVRSDEKKKHWMDRIEEDMKAANITPEDALDRKRRNSGKRERERSGQPNVEISKYFI